MKPTAHDLLRSAARFGAAPTQDVRLAHLCDTSPDARRLAWIEICRRCPGYAKLAAVRAATASSGVRATR